MSKNDLKNYLQINKQHWNTAAVKNWPEKKAELPNIVKDPDLYLKKVEPKLYPYLREIKGKQVVVFQFGDAHVMLACALKEAEVIGIDFSSEQVKLAKEAADFCGVDVDLVEADCQNLPSSVPRSYFDFVVAEFGILIWIANLKAWMRNAYAVLRKGGRLLLQDFHSLSHSAKVWRVKLKDEKVIFRRSYLDQTPEYWFEDDLPETVEYNWKISDIVNAAISVGFRIDYIEEFYDRPEEELNLIPNKYLLVATKNK